MPALFMLELVPVNQATGNVSGIFPVPVKIFLPLDGICTTMQGLLFAVVFTEFFSVSQVSEIMIGVMAFLYV